MKDRFPARISIASLVNEIFVSTSSTCVISLPTYSEEVTANEPVVCIAPAAGLVHPKSAAPPPPDIGLPLASERDPLITTSPANTAVPL